MEKFDIPTQNQKQDKEQNPEQLESEYAERLIEFALDSGIEFDKGQNAVIMEVNPKNLLPEVRDYFFKGEDPNIPDEKFVSKVIKIFRSGEGENEANKQREVKELLEAQDNQDDLAKVPEVYLNKEITIRNEKLKEQLEASGIDMSQDKVSVILMYQVKGINLMDHLMAEAIKGIPEDEVAMNPSVDSMRQQLDSGSDNIDTGQLFGATAMACKFEASSGVFLDAKDNGRLIKHLQKNGFILDPIIISKIENTIKILNEKGIHHNDLTGRNLMFEFEEDGVTIKDVYLIDFEKTSYEEIEGFGGDMAIMAQYKDLTKSREERKEEVVDEALLKAEKFAARVEKAKPEFYKYVKDTLKDMIGGDIARETELMSIASEEVSDQRFEVIGIALMQLAESDLEEGVKKYIELKEKDSKTPGRYRTLLGRIKNKL